MVHITDLYPTILNLAGASLDQEKPLDGKDLWPTLAEGAPAPRTTILHNVNPFTGAIRMGDWKLVWSGEVAANQTHGPETETWELFDLAQDPFEENNLAEARPEILADLKSALQAYQKEAVEPNISPNTMPESFKVPEVWGE